MATCPICKAAVPALDKVSDADGFDCPEHGKFKVAGSVFAVRQANKASREQWEDALKRARARQPDAWAPVITTGDF